MADTNPKPIEWKVIETHAGVIAEHARVAEVAGFEHRLDFIETRARQILAECRRLRNDPSA